MSRTEVFTALNTSTIPVAHMAWPVGSSPALPWCVFYQEDDNVFNADNSRYTDLTPWTVELYEKYADETTEGKLETAILKLTGTYNKMEEYLDEENCLVIIYTFIQTKKGN